MALFSVGPFNLTVTQLLTRKLFLPEGGVSDPPPRLHLAATSDGDHAHELSSPNPRPPGCVFCFHRLIYSLETPERW